MARARRITLAASLFDACAPGQGMTREEKEEAYAVNDAHTAGYLAGYLEGYQAGVVEARENMAAAMSTEAMYKEEEERHARIAG